MFQDVSHSSQHHSFHTTTSMAARELQFNGEQDLTQDTMVLTQDTQVVATAHVGDQFQLQSLFDTAPAELFAAFDNGDEVCASPSVTFIVRGGSVRVEEGMWGGGESVDGGRRVGCSPSLLHKKKRAREEGGGGSVVC